MTTWRKELRRTLADHGEKFPDDVVATTLTEAELDSDERNPFTLWTKDRVYFPAMYDSAEWVASVPRNPCDEKTEHVGGLLNMPIG